jgi:hypothetical protein
VLVLLLVLDIGIFEIGSISYLSQLATGPRSAETKLEAEN